MKFDDTIVICSSAAFYEHAAAIADELHSLGFTSIILPKSAVAMIEANDFTVRKSWYDNDEDYVKKADFMRTHFDHIANGDAVLVINDKKHGVDGYVGPNVLMEMSLAWYLKKPIYMLNELPENTPFEEELKGMAPIVLAGNMAAIMDPSDKN